MMAHGGETPEFLDFASCVFDRTGRWDMAWELALRVEGNSQGTALGTRASILRANILAKRGRLDEALSLLDTIEWGVNDDALLTRILQSKASALRRLGRTTEALDSCMRAGRLAHEMGDSDLRAQCQMEAGSIMVALGDCENGLGELVKARATFEESEKILDIIRCDINTGVGLKCCGRLEEAEDTLSGAAEAAMEAGLNRVRAHALANLSDLLNMRGNYRQSADMAGIAAETFSCLGEPLMEVAALLNLCIGLAGSGERGKAESTMRDAIAILKERDLLESRHEWLEECAKMLKGMGDKGLAMRLRKAGRDGRKCPLNR